MEALYLLDIKVQAQGHCIILIKIHSTVLVQVPCPIHEFESILYTYYRPRVIPIRVTYDRMISL